jgi:hypothetical protein
MTKLTGVNFILRKSGDLPAPSLDTNKSSQAAEAERCLEEESLRVQTHGWVYNTRNNVELTPNAADSKIYLPVGTITIDSDGQDAWRRVTQFGAVLLDLDNNTEIFTTTLRVEYISLFDFDCIPEPVAQLIASKAALTYVENQPVKDRVRLLTLREDLELALAEATRFNAATADANILTDDHARRVKGNRRTSSGFLTR